ncbi:MAG: M28 family metallopeptidase [Christensenellales bacterium]|jgi:alkaline phosphatase isozyme conversion protein
MIKKIIIVILILFTFTAGFAVNAQVGCGYDFMREFVTKFPDRVAGSENEREAADYIKEYYISAGLNPYYDDYIVSFNADDLTSHNVIGFKDSPSDKVIIIGAHYDAVAEGAGVYDNGSGIGAMAEIIARVEDSELTVDLVFIAFGAEEAGLYGSADFVNNMSAEEINNTLLMINLDSISCGDYLYLYTGEVTGNLANYILDIADNSGIMLKKAPYGKDIIARPNEYNGHNYDRLLFQSDHAPFMGAGIDVAFFVGYNLEGLYPEESESLPGVMHTEDDNLTDIIELYTEEKVRVRITSVASIVTALVSDADISGIIASGDNKFDYKWMMNEKGIKGVMVGVKAIVLGIMFIIYLKYYNKVRHLKPEIKAKSDEEYVFDDLKI